jgi:hypothetical protein
LIIAVYRCPLEQPCAFEPGPRGRQNVAEVRALRVKLPELIQQPVEFLHARRVVQGPAVNFQFLGLLPVLIPAGGILKVLMLLRPPAEGA